jgi:hypothetical protein
MLSGFEGYYQQISYQLLNLHGVIHSKIFYCVAVINSFRVFGKAIISFVFASSKTITRVANT